MSTLKSELTEKIDEARGMLSNLIFGKKSQAKKKPKEMIDTMKQWLQALVLQQQAIAAQQAAAQAAALLALSPANATASASTPTAITAVASPQTAGTAPVALATSTSPSNAPAALSIPSPANSGVVTLLPDGAVTSPTPNQQAVAVGLQTPGGQLLSPSANTEFASSITSDLDQMVTLLYGDASADKESGGVPDPRLAKEVIDLMFEADLFSRLLVNIRYLEFEARKFFTRIFEYALTQRRDLSVPYILSRRHILYQLIHAYEEKDVSIALACDAILRACIACEPIDEMILMSGCQQQPVASPNAAAASAVSSTDSDSSFPSSIYESESGDMVLLFFPYLDLPTFINSHAFASFKMVLQAFPHLGAQYFLRSYPVFFGAFNKLLCSENYLTKVQAFQFLGEILMERSNQEIMMRYVNEAENLKLAMMALRGPKAIQLAVFNVLKVFVPNPYKADSVLRILTQNKRNFLAFLDEFERDSEDEVLVAHKQEMIAALQELPDAVPPVKKLSAASPEEAVANNAQQQQQQQHLQGTPISNKEELP